MEPDSWTQIIQPCSKFHTVHSESLYYSFTWAFKSNVKLYSPLKTTFMKGC